jgi:hypothetical protein
MKSFNIEVLFADNGGLCLHVPSRGPKGASDTRTGKLYLTKDMTPQAIGELFLALHVDVKLSDASLPNLDSIEF